MTAALVFTQGKRGYLLADMAYTEVETGLVRYIDSKFVVANGRVPWAAIPSGTLNPHALARKMQGRDVPNASAFLRGLPDVLRELEQDVRDEGAPPLVAGLYGLVWSARLSRPCAFMVWNDTSRSGVGNDLEPYQVVPVDYANSGAANIPQLLGRPVKVNAARDFDPRTDGVKVMDRLRETSTDGQHLVAGGGVQLLTFGRVGSLIETLKLYPDKVGERIGVETLRATLAA
jgi:hypothetical protein